MNKHGGSRVGAGRKARTEPKAGLIWCGQISQEDRAFIIQHLSPNDRYQVLMAAANNCVQADVAKALSEKTVVAKFTRITTSDSPKLFPAEVISPAKARGAKRRR